jgi:gas vesicle structural protein
MTVATQGNARGYLQRAPAPTGLADVVDLILDKGLVIDAYVRISLVGIEVLTIDARIVIASVDTYLRFAEAVNRLDLTEQSKDLPEMVEGTQESGARGKVRGAVEGAKETFTGDGQREKEEAKRD